MRPGYSNTGWLPTIRKAVLHVLAGRVDRQDATPFETRFAIHDCAPDQCNNAVFTVRREVAGRVRRTSAALTWPGVARASNDSLQGLFCDAAGTRMSYFVHRDSHTGKKGPRTVWHTTTMHVGCSLDA